MFDSLFTVSETADTSITAPNLLIAIASALVLGLMISLVYMKTHRNKSASQSFSLTLIMLPAVITVIIVLVGSNIARAFSLAGAFSIIRFRSAPGDSKDITYVLFSMAVGLATGMGYVMYAAIVAVILCGVMFLLETLGYGNVKTTGKVLKITIPENLDYQNTFENIMENYTTENKLRKVKTTELGSLYELTYDIVMKNNASEKEFIDSVRCRNGNLSVTLALGSNESEL